jgi:hypothetical protein
MKPTRKWWAARAIAIGALATMFVTTGGWDAEETVAVLGLVTEGIVSWLVPNESTPGGVPA